MKTPEMTEHYKTVQTKKYAFGSKVSDGICVASEKRYQVTTENADYGFLTEENRNQEERLQLPELNSGFDTVYWYRGHHLTHIEADENGCFVKWEQRGNIPLTFVSDVPEEGNYQVKVTLYAPEKVENAIIFLGRRRLAYLGTIEAGDYQGTFVTNICPIVPRGKAEAMEDTTLDVTIIGDNLHLKEIEIAPFLGKTIYIAGDSTVTDQSADYPYLPELSYCGWGQMLSAFVQNQAAVSNHAHSGLTTLSFRSEGHYEILYRRLKPGDICLIQFGHNDQKLPELVAEAGYTKEISKYVEEVQKTGAIPVLITPLARNSWRGDDGTYNDLLEDFAAACKNIAKQYDIPCIDLHEKSKEMVIRAGREDAKRFYFPSDYTHSNDYGAFLFAKYVYEGLVENRELGFLPMEQQSGIQTEWTPPEKIEKLVPPKELENIPNPAEERLFENLDRPEEALTRVEALEFVITTMHFFPTNVYNDSFTDVIGHETYAGTVECGCQNGLIPEDMVADGKFYPLQKIIGKEFFQMVLNGYKSRKPVTDPLRKEICQQLSLEGTITRETAAKICRNLNI